MGQKEVLISWEHCQIKMTDNLDTASTKYTFAPAVGTSLGENIINAVNIYLQNQAELPF